MYDKKAFCKGNLCRTSDRKYKSYISGVTGCGLCMIKVSKNKYCTIDEFVMAKDELIQKAWKLF